jgi:hypothetical protein
MPNEELTYRDGVKNDLAEIKTLVRYTNGKVRKIIIALVLLSGIMIGQNFSSAHDIISLLAGLAH